MNNNDKTVWKVVRVEKENTYYSCVMDSPDIAIQYKVGEFVKPIINNSKILVFSTREKARAFMRVGHALKQKIFKCKAKNLTEAPKYLAWYTNNTQIREYWSDTFVRTTSTMPTPPKTLLCDELMLIKETDVDQRIQLKNN